MSNLVIGFVAGIIVATIGFSGVAKLADPVIKQAQVELKEQVKK